MSGCAPARSATFRQSANSRGATTPNSRRHSDISNRIAAALDGKAAAEVAGLADN
jgi:hypothetical protein